MIQSYNTTTFSQIVVGSAQYLLRLMNSVKKQDYHRPCYKQFQVIKLKSDYVIARFKINTNMSIKPLRDHFEQPLHCLKAEIGKFQILKTTWCLRTCFTLACFGLLFTMPVQYLEGEDQPADKG